LIDKKPSTPDKSQVGNEVEVLASQTRDTDTIPIARYEVKNSKISKAAKQVKQQNK
jgi:hypothetical protein